LVRLSALYGRDHGLALLHRLEEHRLAISELYAFSGMPSLGQLRAVIDEAYRTGPTDDLRRLLRAYTLFFKDVGTLNPDRLNVLALGISAGLPAHSTTVFCANCSLLNNSSVQGACGRCHSPTVSLSSFDLGAVVRQGVGLHVPLELYSAASLESAGYHLVRAGEEGHDSAISITFNAFGSKIDVDALGIGHPPCVVFLAATTSKVDQGKAMAIQGPIMQLQKMLKERFPDMPPFQTVIVALGDVDDNLDLVGLERTGVTVYRASQVPALAKELGKVPPRLSGK